MEKLADLLFACFVVFAAIAAVYWRSVGKPLCDRLRTKLTGNVKQQSSRSSHPRRRSSENKENAVDFSASAKSDSSSLLKERTSNEPVKKTRHPSTEKSTSKRPCPFGGMAETENAQPEPPPPKSDGDISNTAATTCPMDTDQCSAADEPTPNNDVQKSVTREVTSDDKTYHETSTEMVREKRGNTETVSFVKEEHSISVDGGEEEGSSEAKSEQSKPQTSAVSETKTTVRSEETKETDADATSGCSVTKVTKFESTSSETTSRVSSSNVDGVTLPNGGIGLMTNDLGKIFDERNATSSPALSSFSSHTISEMSNTTETTTSPFLFRLGCHAKSPQPTIPVSKAGKPRPTSAPPMDSFDIFQAMNLGTAPSSVRTDNESADLRSSQSPAPLSHVYLPSADSDPEFIATQKTRKMFSSSSFYDEPMHIYPTVEEQVELCRKIADSLVDDTNRKSKGANMFFKRVKRSNKWVHEGPYPNSAEGSVPNSDSEAQEPPTPDVSTMPYLRVSKGPPQLKLILDPRQLLDASKLRSAGQNVNEHNVVSPDICLDLVKDLNSPVGKGAALFAKRKMKSEEWVVDEEKVKAHLQEKAREVSSTPEPPPPSYVPPAVPPLEKITERLQNPRVKLVKSPWEAALESPIGSVDSAFAETTAEKVAQTVIQRASNIVAESEMNNSYSMQSSTAGQPALQFAPSPPQSIYCTLPRIYQPKPRGWTGSTAASASESTPPAPPQRTNIPYYEPAGLSPTSLLTQQHKPTLPTFQNFNASPKSWTAAQRSPSNTGFRPVRIPTVMTH